MVIKFAFERLILVSLCYKTEMTIGSAMLKESKLPAKFYREAQLTAVYVYNRLTHGGDYNTI